MSMPCAVSRQPGLSGPSCCSYSYVQQLSTHAIPCPLFPHTPGPPRPLLTFSDHTPSSSLNSAKIMRYTGPPGNQTQAGAFHLPPKFLQLLGDPSACQALMWLLFCLILNLFLQLSSEYTSDSSPFHSHFPINSFLTFTKQVTCKSMHGTSRQGENVFCAWWDKGAFY